MKAILKTRGGFTRIVSVPEPPPVTYDMAEFDSPSSDCYLPDGKPDLIPNMTVSKRTFYLIGVRDPSKFYVSPVVDSAYAKELMLREKQEAHYREFGTIDPVALYEEREEPKKKIVENDDPKAPWNLSRAYREFEEEKKLQAAKAEFERREQERERRKAEAKIRELERKVRDEEARAKSAQAHAINIQEMLTRGIIDERVDLKKATAKKNPSDDVPVDPGYTTRFINLDIDE